MASPASNEFPEENFASVRSTACKALISLRTTYMKIYFDDPEYGGQFLRCARLRAAGRTDRRSLGDCGTDQAGRCSKLVQCMVVLCRSPVRLGLQTERRWASGQRPQRVPARIDY